MKAVIYISIASAALVAALFFVFENRENVYVGPDIPNISEAEFPLLPVAEEDIIEKEIISKPGPGVRALSGFDSEAALDKISEEISGLKEALDSFVKSQKTLPEPTAVGVKSEEVYAKALSALVNIFCEDQAKGVYILGSGAIVSERGHVLTNAHLASNWESPGVNCILRSGSPAKPFAKAKVVFLPEQDSKIGNSQISAKDVAILKITELVAPGSITDKFEYFNFNSSYLVSAGEVLYSFSYPTEFLGSQTILQNTALLFTLGTVSNFVTLDEDRSDAEGAYLKGEISAQHGSSGGIFLEAKTGSIAGLFVGLTEGETTSARQQFIFLSPYINEIFLAEKGMGLNEFLATNP